MSLKDKRNLYDHNKQLIVNMTQKVITDVQLHLTIFLQCLYVVGAPVITYSLASFGK